MSARSAKSAGSYSKRSTWRCSSPASSPSAASSSGAESREDVANPAPFGLRGGRHRRGALGRPGADGSRQGCLLAVGADGQTIDLFGRASLVDGGLELARQRLNAGRPEETGRTLQGVGRPLGGDPISGREASAQHLDLVRISRGVLAQALQVARRPAQRIQLHVEPRNARQEGAQLFRRHTGTRTAVCGGPGAPRTSLRQPLQQRCVQGVRIDRFTDVVVHSCLQALRPILPECVGGHRENRYRAPARQAADGARRVEPVRLRHLHVHQDQVVGAPLCHLQRFFPGAGDVDLQSHRPQQVERHLLIDDVVLGQQKTGTGVRERQGLAGIGARQGGVDDGSTEYGDQLTGATDSRGRCRCRYPPPRSAR